MWLLIIWALEHPSNRKKHKALGAAIEWLMVIKYCSWENLKPWISCPAMMKIVKTRRFCLPMRDRLVTSCHLETEMPLLQKQTPNVLSCSEVIHDDEVLIPEIPEVMSPKSDADCGNQVTRLCSGYREEVCHVVKN